MTGRLAGKKILITGGSSGIGRAIAQLAVAEGGQVAIAGAPNDHDDLRQTANDLGVVPLEGDLAQPKSCLHLFDTALKRLGDIDVLVNNAGFGYVESVLNMSVEQWDKLFAVNVRAMFILSKVFAEHISGQKKDSGVIVNTSSTNANHPEPGLAAYNASKSGVMGLTRTLALEFASLNIRVNAVLPGMTRTRQTHDLFQDDHFTKQYVAQIPLGRLAEPSDIAPSYIFLASDEARYITGTTITVDGGLTTGILWPSNSQDS